MAAGSVGRSVWVEAGHEVKFSSRTPEKLAPIIRKHGAQASVATFCDAAKFGNVVLVAIRYPALAEIARDIQPAVRGKIVLDACNPFPPNRCWRASLQAMSGFISGAGLERISVADYVAYDRASTGNNWRIPAGYGTLISHSLPAATDLRLTFLFVQTSRPRRFVLLPSGIVARNAEAPASVNRYAPPSSGPSIQPLATIFTTVSLPAG